MSKYMGILSNGERVLTKKVYKVFTKDRYGFENKVYCYSKEDAIRQRNYMQCDLNIKKVMIKARR